MSSLEVLQTFPTQWKNLLTSLGAMDPENSNIIMLKLDDFKTRLSHQLAFQIATKISGKTIRRIVLDEDATTSIMYLSCWRAIGSMEINRSPTTLKDFNPMDYYLPSMLNWGESQSPFILKLSMLLWTTTYS